MHNKKHRAVMEEVRQKLKHKYGNEILTKDVLKNELNKLMSQGFIERIELDINEEMDVDSFVSYLTTLKRNNFMNNCSIFDHSKEMDDDLNGISHDVCASISDFNEDEKIQNRIDIMNDVVQKYVAYEKKGMANIKKRKMVHYSILAGIALLLAWLFYPEEDPY